MALHYRKFVYNILTFLLTLTLIMGVSIFTYGTFYFAYMPTEVHSYYLTMMISGAAEVHEEEINFQFSPCESSPGPCSFPNTSLKLDPRRHRSADRTQSQPFVWESISVI